MTDEQLRPRRIEERLLPWRRVKDMTGLSRTTAWRMQQRGDFPPPVVISPGRVGWRESEVGAWQQSRAPRAEPQPRPCRAARVAPETRTIALASDRPEITAPPALAEPPAASAENETPPEAEAKRARPRRPNPDQISFDF